jgi:hypothetical protein
MTNNYDMIDMNLTPKRDTVAGIPHELWDAGDSHVHITSLAGEFSYQCHLPGGVVAVLHEGKAYVCNPSAFKELS